MIKNRLVLAMALFSLVISFVLIQETYAKYQTTAEGTTNISIARWKIKINSQDIITDSVITNTITPIFSGNEHIKAGVIAPKSEGYFDIVIDSTNVDVSFKYTVSTSINENSVVDDLNVTGYSLNGGTIIPVSGSLNDVTNTIMYGSSTTTNSLRIYIAWEDFEEENMNNSDDTLAALSEGKANLDVLLTFTQIAN